jgi:hypothetical protein
MNETYRVEQYRVERGPKTKDGPTRRVEVAQVPKQELSDGQRISSGPMIHIEKPPVPVQKKEETFSLKVARSDKDRPEEDTRPVNVVRDGGPNKPGPTVRVPVMQITRDDSTFSGAVTSVDRSPALAVPNGPIRSVPVVAVDSVDHSRDNAKQRRRRIRVMRSDGEVQSAPMTTVTPADLPKEKNA